ncbi:hypothetical protein RhiirB3_441638 [Rhizophagus irregularis]|nr:hypothetical protein RhiirB3_441638 [Rhizophagus irregularis]
MACSKIFLGDLPELTNGIIQYLHHDYKTLYSCILVNRLWCHSAIPLLWENPFSNKFLKNYHFIEIYLHNLNDDDKIKLNEYGINNDLIPSNTLFNYPSFIQHFTTRKFNNSIRNWEITINQHSNYTIQSSNFIKFIYKSLFLIFIENEVNLYSLKVSLFTDEEREYFDDTLELILQNQNFFNNIKILKLVSISAETLLKFSKILNSNCNSISSLYFKFLYQYCFEFPYNTNNQMMKSSLSQIINSQKNLKKILLNFNGFPLYNSLLSLKNSNCLNTLNTIIFYCISFKNIIVLLNEAFNQLNVLESVHIIFCSYLNTEFIQQFINITKPFKLKSLFLNKVLQIESLELLIQIFGNNIEDFGIKKIDESQQLLQLLGLVITYCYKIKFLYLSFWLNSQNINLIFNLIENIKQNLKYLFIEISDFSSVYLSSILLLNLGQILPFKLEYLNLNLVIDRNALEAFLKNSQNTFIKKLLIFNRSMKKGEDIFPCIKEYIMKKKRVKYLAISDNFYENSDLSLLEDKVNESKLYDVQLLNYFSLNINIENFIFNDDNVQ